MNALFKRRGSPEELNGFAFFDSFRLGETHRVLVQRHRVKNLAEVVVRGVSGKQGRVPFARRVPKSNAKGHFFTAEV